MEEADFRVDPDDLRRSMRLWATGVTVVTSRYDHQQHGMTVSSFTSVSLSPPLVLVSLERITRTHILVEASGFFGVTVLSSEQQAVSDRFAGRDTENLDRFEGLEIFTLVTGSPMLVGGLACFDCRVVEKFWAGNHTLFIGEVIATFTEPELQEPLIYYNRGYRYLRVDSL